MYHKNVEDDILGHMKISDIKKANIIQFYENLKEKGLSYGTVCFFHKLFSAVFNMALDNELVRSNPAKRALEAIGGTHKKKNALTKNQQDGFLLYLNRQDRDLYRKVLFLIETMCRISEFAGLTWEDVDMKNRIITIDHQLQYKSYDGKKAEYHINPTKNTHTRKIPMTDNVYDILCEIRKFYFKERPLYRWKKGFYISIRVRRTDK